MIVLDVNVAVAMARNTEEGQALRMLMNEREPVIVPRHFMEEIGNVAWKYAYIGDLSPEDSLSLFQNALDVIDGFVDTEPLLVEAIHEAIRNEHPVYDMLYMVLARRNAATLFTFDKRLRRICAANGVNCVEMMQL